jgi:hypothetical protein
MNAYQGIIVKATGCNNEDAAKIEDIMRNDIFHSTLDWQTKSQLVIGAKEAMKILKVLKRYQGARI